MMTRGEVALIVAQKGLAIGVVDPVYFTAVILLIVVSSVTTRWHSRRCSPSTRPCRIPVRFRHKDTKNPSGCGRRDF